MYKLQTKNKSALKKNPQQVIAMNLSLRTTMYPKLQVMSNQMALDGQWSERGSVVQFNMIPPLTE